MISDIENKLDKIRSRYDHGVKGMRWHKKKAQSVSKSEYGKSAKDKELSKPDTGGVKGTEKRFFDNYLDDDVDQYNDEIEYRKLDIDRNGDITKEGYKKYKDEVRSNVRTALERNRMKATDEEVNRIADKCALGEKELSEKVQEAVYEWEEMEREEMGYPRPKFKIPRGEYD